MTVLGTKADFSQRDKRWSAKMLGFAKWQTIGAYGCYVTAYANVAQANGKDVDVNDMNNLLKEKGLFSVDSVGERSDISRNDALSVVFPDIKYVETKNWGNALADIAYFDVRGTTKTEIIVKLDYHPERSGIQTHFCRVIGTNAQKTDVEVVDSYTGKRVWVSSFGAPAAKLIYSAVKFSGPGTDNHGGTSTSNTPPTQTLPQSYVGKRVYLDVNNANVPVYQSNTNNIKGHLDPKNYPSARSYQIKRIDAIPNRVGIHSGLFGDVSVTVDNNNTVR